MKSPLENILNDMNHKTYSPTTVERQNLQNQSSKITIRVKKTP